MALKPTTPTGKHSPSRPSAHKFTEPVEGPKHLKETLLTGRLFFILLSMKSLRLFLLILLFMFPVASWGEMFPLLSELRDSTDSSSRIPAAAYLIPFPYSITIGGGPGMFSVGTDLLISPLSAVYVDEVSRPDSVQGPWVPSHVLLWTNRIRMIYDYDNHQYGFFWQPNIRYVYRFLLADIAVGPEIGWQTQTGFEWGGFDKTEWLIDPLFGGSRIRLFRKYRKVLFQCIV